MSKGFRRSIFLGLAASSCLLFLGACHRGQAPKTAAAAPAPAASVDPGGTFAMGWWKVTQIVEANGTGVRSRNLERPLLVGHSMLIDPTRAPVGKCAPGPYTLNRRWVNQEDIFDAGQRRYFDPVEAGIHDRLIYEVKSFCPGRFYCSIDRQHLYVPAFGVLMVLEHQDTPQP